MNNEQAWRLPQQVRTLGDGRVHNDGLGAPIPETDRTVALPEESFVRRRVLEGRLVFLAERLPRVGTSMTIPFPGKMSALVSRHIQLTLKRFQSLLQRVTPLTIVSTD